MSAERGYSAGGPPDVAHWCVADHNMHRGSIAECGCGKTDLIGRVSVEYVAAPAPVTPSGLQYHICRATEEAPTICVDCGIELPASAMFRAPAPVAAAPLSNRAPNPKSDIMRERITAQAPAPAQPAPSLVDCGVCNGTGLVPDSYYPTQRTQCIACDGGGLIERAAAPEDT